MSRVMKYGAFAIASSYLIAGVAWILFSDAAAEAMFSNSPDLLTLVQTAKGFVFVLVTALLLYWVVRFLIGKERSSSELMRQSEQTYRELFDFNPLGLIVCDKSTLAIVNANHSAEILFGITAEAGEKYNLKSLFPGGELSKLLDLLDQVSVNNTSGQVREFIQYDARGDLVETAIAIRRMSYQQEEALLLIVQNLSEERKNVRILEHALQRLDIARQVSGMGCWEIDLSNQQIYCCENVRAMLDLPEGESPAMTLEYLEQKADIRMFQKAIRALSEEHGQEEVRFDGQLKGKRGSKRHVVVHAIRNDERTSSKVVGTFIDLSRQKKTEQDLRNREGQLMNLLNILPEGVLTLSKSQVSYANDAAARIFCVDNPAKLEGRNIRDFVEPDHEEAVNRRLEWIRAENQIDDGRFIQHMLRRNDGQLFEAEVSARKIPSGDEDQVQVVVRDMSETVRMKDALQNANTRLTALTSKTMEMLEKDRKHIAGALHDDVGQSLTAIKLGISWAEKRVSETNVSEKLGNLRDIVGDTLQKVRDLSLMLRPAQLDSLGLPAAIEWQAEKLFSDAGITFSFDSDRYGDGLSKDIEITAFRIVQESLTNVIRHAEASAVSVLLETDADGLRIRIVDDGRGFDVESQRSSLGLVNMKERVEVSGGEIVINSLKGIGTEVSVSLPQTAAPPNIAAAELSAE